MKIYNTDKNKEHFTDEGCHIIEVLNQPETESVSVAHARVQVGATTQLHALQDTSEIYYILEGRGIANVDGVLKQLEKGDCIIIAPDKSQSIENNGDRDLKFLCICQPRFLFSNYTDLSK